MHRRRRRRLRATDRVTNSNHGTAVITPSGKHTHGVQIARSAECLAADMAYISRVEVPAVDDEGAAAARREFDDAVAVDHPTFDVTK
jgi:hypothetical protein